MPGIVSALEADGWHCYGHAHPRWRGRIDDEMTEAGLEVLMRDSDVFEEASVLVVDNSSLGPEMMLLGRPVIWLDAPWYRHDVNHGGRFWEWTWDYLTNGTPDELLADLEELSVGDGLVERLQSQRHTVRRIYKHRDGTSARLAADFIVQRLNAM